LTPAANADSRIRLKPLLIVTWACVHLVSAAVVTQAVSFWDDVPDEVLAPALVDQMSDEEVIAQTLLVGWVGQEPSPEVLQWIRERNLGGVKVFGWNGGDLVGLANAIGEMQRAATSRDFGIPLLTATDQEGGWVRHIKGNEDLETSITPGNMAIGSSGLPYDAYRSAYLIGLELRALGVNMNFAPTVDVYVNPEAHVIGPRAFSSDPVQSGLLGVAYFEGLEKARIIATAKHFPGHGNASGDSHGVLPVIRDTMDTLWSRDLVPYRFLIAEGLPAILTGHLNFPEVTGDGRPASLSRQFETTVLRGELGFTGIVMTDDLYMGGAWQYGAARGWGISELVVEAIRAGNDMVLLSRTPDFNGEIWQTVLAEYRSDPAFRDRVREAALGVIRTKLRYLKPADRVPLYPDPSLLPQLMTTDEGRTYFRDQAGRSVVVVADEDIPHRTRDDETVLLTGKDRDFLRIGQQFYPDADQYRISASSFDTADPAESARLKNLAANYDTVVFCLSDPGTLGVLEGLEDVEATVIVMSILTPIYLSEVPWVGSSVAVFGWGEESFRAGFSVIQGDMTAEGHLPVRLPPAPGDER